MGQLLASLLDYEKKKEFFVDSLRPNRPPLSGNSALQALRRAEAIDQYRTTVEQSSLNVIARLNYTYMPSVHTVSIPIEPADPKDPWPNGQVLWMNSTADGGLPHTRAPYYICLPVSINKKTLSTTLLHERIHLSQRAQPKFWIALMELCWSMTPFIGLLPAELSLRQRINPDIFGVPLFAWKKQWVPLAIFQSVNQPALSEIDIIWWDSITRTIHRDPPPGWETYFGKYSVASEHPYEMAAYLISSPETMSKLPAYQALKSRLNELPVSEV
jgi:hypothetical protein